MNFRNAFTRKASFEWFIIVIIGLMIKGDGIGVTSIIRELSIDPNHYENLLHFFRSNAWSIEMLVNTWVNTVKVNAPLLTICGWNILIGDGVKEPKEGKKMPGVKKLHQESENSSKSEYIFGHLFGVVSVLIGQAGKQFSLPLSASMQDGVNIIRKYSDPLAVIESHVIQVIIQAGNAAKQLGKSVVLLDRYFLSVPALQKAMEYWDDNGEQLLQFVVKAKISYTAYTEPRAYSGKGRPRKKGDSVKLKDLFVTEADKFICTELYLYGKTQTVQYYCTDLLWGKKLYQKLRFVLVKTESYPPSILVSTSLLLSPNEIIELYSYRYKIEISFKTLKHTVFGFCYHFWSAYMPKLSRYHKEWNTEALEAITDIQIQQKITATLKAIEGFVMCSCIACGLLQMLAIKYADIINSSKIRWLRTIRNSTPSEDTVAYYLRKTFFRLVIKYPYFDIMRIIISKQFDHSCQSGKSS